jgi:hypothetical protein
MADNADAGSVDAAPEEALIAIGAPSAMLSVEVQSPVIAPLPLSMLFDYRDPDHMPVFPDASALCGGWFSANQHRRFLMLFNDSTATDIPDDINLLKELQRMHISRCDALQRLPEMRANQLLMLTHLHITECRSLTALPDSIEHLHGLCSLYVHNCASFDYLPPSVGRLQKLTNLTMSQLPIRRLPDELCRLSGLTVLDVSRCDRLTCLPTDLGDMRSLRTINLTGALQLRELPTSLGKRSDSAKNIALILIMTNTAIVFPPPSVCARGTWYTLAWLSLRHTEKVRAQHAMMLLRLHTAVTRRDGIPSEIWHLVQSAVSRHLVFKYMPSLGS